MESSPLYHAINTLNACCTLVHVVLNAMMASSMDSTKTEELYAILEKVLNYDIDMCYARAYNAFRAYCRILKGPAKNGDHHDHIDFKKSCHDVNEIKGYKKKEWTVSVDSILDLLGILQSATKEHQKACARIKMSDAKPLGEVTLEFINKRKRFADDDETRFDAATRTQYIHGGVYSWTEEVTGKINGQTYDAMLEIILQEIKQLQERIPDLS
jgi:hypothetical protein